MNIGIDIDDTINNLYEMITKRGTEFNKRENIIFDINPNEWFWDKAFGWDDITADKFLKENIQEIFLTVGIKKDAAEIINKLHEEENRIIIITARHEEHCKNIYEVSKTWLISNNIKFDKLIVNAGDKAEICKDNKIDVLIDDNIYVCKEVSKTNTKVLMFNSPYNQNETNFKRVNSWKEVYNEII